MNSADASLQDSSRDTPLTLSTSHDESNGKGKTSWTQDCDVIQEESSFSKVPGGKTSFPAPRASAERSTFLDPQQPLTRQFHEVRNQDTSPSNFHSQRKSTTPIENQCITGKRRRITESPAALIAHRHAKENIMNYNGDCDNVANEVTATQKSTTGLNSSISDNMNEDGINNRGSNGNSATLLNAEPMTITSSSDEDKVVDFTPDQMPKPPTGKTNYSDSSSSDDLSNASFMNPMKPSSRKKAVKTEVPPSSPLDRKPKAQLKSIKAGDSDDDSDDDSEPYYWRKRKSGSGNRKRRSTSTSRSSTLKKKHKSPSNKGNGSKLAARFLSRRRYSSTLTSQDLEGLEEIEKDEDKALQVLLWKLGLRFKLLNHQFKGCRGVAGVPENFPMHQDVITEPTKITLDVAMQGLPPEPTTQGLLLADDMGLGKTIQAISGSFLHSAIRKAKRKQPLPTLIICPNDALIEQWMGELRLNGINGDKILYVKRRKQIGSGGFSRCYQYVFMTRYTLQAETKDLMTECDKRFRPQRTKSGLFPSIGPSFLPKFSALYRTASGKEREKLSFRHDGEPLDDCSSRILANQVSRNEVRPCYGLLIIDEAHFLKNRLSYWGFGSSLLGVHASRTIAMTGTPYCNGASDMAALQSYIQIDTPAARTRWWDNATKVTKSGSSIAAKVSEWQKKFLIRRRKEEILKDVLPEKTVAEVQVQPYPAELSVYDSIESKLRKLMEKYAVQADDYNRDPELANALLAYFSLARASIIHPVLPNGREITIQFSKSRRHLAPYQINRNACVSCNQLQRPMVPSMVAVKEDEDEDVLRGNQGPGMDFDLQETNEDDDEVQLGLRQSKRKEDKGKLVKCPPQYCQKYCEDLDSGHYIHEKCLKMFEASCPTRCPRCEDLERRIKIAPDGGKSAVPHKRYCQDVQGGFVASSKIEMVIQKFKEVPKDDKVIVLSFFKGALDLLEGVFDDMGLDIARYDGDLKNDARREQLEYFKSEDSCRILLATVHVLGTGLNIVQANHVFFVDRWFNPTVHDQAQDRTYRIGQEKPVFVSFFDSSGTIDIAMRLTNQWKKENSRILLADGVTDLGEGGMSFRALNGLMSNMLSQLQVARQTQMQNVGGADTPFAAMTQESLQELLSRLAQMSRRKWNDLDDSYDGDGTGES